MNLFGHANERINGALVEQLEQLEHVMLAGFTHAPVIELSERLSRLTGGALGHCFYASDGASAVEIALKMSFHYWRNRGRPGRTQFVSIAGSYHGETLGALSVTDVPLFRDTYEPLLRGTAQVPSPDWRLAAAGESPGAYAKRCAEALDAHLERHHGETAAVILEPLVQGATGMAMYDPEYLRAVRASCDRYEVHLIADEIMTGFGRTGTFFAHEQARITPDYLCLSKGLTGGYLPLAAVLTRDEIFQAFYDDSMSRGFLHSHSYTGSALACRAALATLDIFESDDVIAANRAKSAAMSERLDRVKHHPRVRDFRNTGMIWAFEVESAGDDIGRRIHLAALELELLLRPIGRTVYVMPPYVISDEEQEILANGLLGALDSLS